MAGESPDRSKQHESSTSSAEPTRGRPAPVPAPAASADRDPRLAMSREKVRVDQATAVFSTRALKEAVRDVSDGAGGSNGSGGAGSSGRTEVEAPGDSSGAEGASEAGGAGETGDARLREAVAAWVRGAEPTGDADADARADSDAEGAGAGADDAAGADGEAEDAHGVSGAEGEPEGAEGASDAEGDAEGDLEAADRPEAAGDEADAAGEKDSGRGVAEADGSEGAASRVSAEESAATAVGAEDADAEGAKDGAESAAAGVDAEGAATAVDAEDADAEGAKDGAESAAAGVDAEGAATAVGAGKNADPAVDAEDADVEDAVAGAVSDVDADKSAASAEDVDPALSDGAAPSGDTETPDGDTAEPSAADARPGDSAEDTGADEAAPEPAVDQPTAIFKAPRPPAVDQPTTMLKLGGTKPAGKPAPGEGAGAKPAGKPVPAPDAKPAGKVGDKPAGGDAGVPPAERTSKFVALKPLDEPSLPKPAPAPAEATAALPQVGPERTAQQPLPPKPPLDLLAELTNTPPPRQTPVRTIVRRIKIWTPLVIVLAIVFAVVQAVRPLPAGGLALTADETYTFEGGKLDLPWPGQGQSAIEVDGVGSLGTEGTQTPRPIASVAKIMTAYVTLQEHPLKGNEGGEKITVDQQAEDESRNEDESTAAMTKGQQFAERQMLQMLMIPSGNNAARLLARWDSDNKTFVGRMNAAAKKLGMTKTTYTDPSGLEKTTVSTAADQLKLAKAVMQNEVFRSIVGMAKADIPGLDKPIYNNNDLLVKQVGVIGLKTGSSTPAGGNLVWAATKTVNGKTQTVYGAVMNQDAGTGRVWDSLQLAITNSQKLIDTIQKGLTSATVVKKGEVVGYVDDQLGGKTPVVATKNMTAIGWPGLKTKLSIDAGAKTVPHEAKTGTVVGELTVGDGSSHAVKIPVALQSDLTEPGYGTKLTRLG